MTYSFKWNGDEFSKRAVGAAEKGLEAAAMSLAETARRSFGVRHGGVPSKPGGPPNSQTGNLRRRIVWVGPRAMGPLRAAFGTDVAYGRHLEFGAHPKARDKYLTVPLHPQAARALRRAGSVRQIPGLQYRPPKKTNTRSGGVLGKVVGRGASRKLVAWFALMTDVVIRPRPWLRPAAKVGMPAAQRMFNMAVSRELRRTA